MSLFIGVKLIKAQAMTRAEYNSYRGWPLPEDEDGCDEGYLVEYMDGGKSNMPGREGYVSWSPKDVFERSYRPTSGMTFGLAIEAMKNGAKVARTGWNGKGMFISLSPGTKDLPAANFWNPHNRDFAIDNGGVADVLPCFTMKTADDKILMGWLASQTDMLAEDWQIIV